MLPYTCTHRGHQVKINLREVGCEDVRFWTGVVWHRIEPSGGLLLTRCVFGFHKERASDLIKKDFGFMDLVISKLK
jgi:hypothetical protein